MWRDFARGSAGGILQPSHPESAEMIFLGPQGQTYVFQCKIARGIQKWVQNNQLSALPRTQ